jgi:hyperosmotically inducible periplasmic protein
MKLFQTRFMLLLAAFAIMSTTMISCKGSKSDAEIHTEVTKKLNSEDASKGLTATVSKGVVTLQGECKDAACKQNCEQSVKNIEGVKSVVNNIQIAQAEVPQAPVEVTADEPLRAAVSDAVKNYKGVQAEVKDGVVTLRGEIKRDNMQPLMMSLNALKPKKIENELVIK